MLTSGKGYRDHATKGVGDWKPVCHLAFCCCLCWGKGRQLLDSFILQGFVILLTPGSCRGQLETQQAAFSSVEMGGNVPMTAFCLAQANLQMRELLREESVVFRGKKKNKLFRDFQFPTNNHVLGKLFPLQLLDSVVTVIKMRMCSLELGRSHSLNAFNTGYQAAFICNKSSFFLFPHWYNWSNTLKVLVMLS